MTDKLKNLQPNNNRMEKMYMKFCNIAKVPI